MEEGDIRSLAEQLIQQHGDKAAAVAADKFVALQRAGDNDGMAKWVQVMLAVRELSRKGD